MKDFRTYLQKLNSDQLKAVETIEGPVMVIAGPGTGKTYTLTLRIANILAKTDARPENILALTFTDSAAMNMQKRLVEIIGNDAYKVKIMTFHSFCNEVLQRFPEKFGFNEFYNKITELEKIRFIEQIIDETELKYLTNFADPYMYKKEISSIISELKKESINPDEFAKIVKEELVELNSQEKINPRTKKVLSKWLAEEKKLLKNQELASIYKTYQSKLRKEQRYDFDDMILYVTEGFQSDEELLAYFQEQFLYILVDEFQDTNGAQSRILELLASYDNKPNLFVVGDDAQSIFRFQGANVENMYDFVKKFPDTEVINLKESYRCPQDILNGAESLLSQNKLTLGNVLGFERAIHSNSSVETKIKFTEIDTLENEYVYLVKQIQKLLKNGVGANDIAVIYKNHRDADLLKELLFKSKTPFSEKSSKNALASKYVIKFLNLLKTIANTADNTLLYEVLNYDFCSIERLELFKLANQTSKSGTNMFESALNYEDAKIREFADKMLVWQKASYNQHLTEFFLTVLNESRLLDFLKDKHNMEAVRDLSKLFFFAKRISKGDFEYRLKNFLDDINAIEENRLDIALDYIDSREGVNLMTAHRSKGLEFDYIFILNLYEGKWSNTRDFGKLKLPSGLLETMEKEVEKNEEERRLLYVAITRAKKAVELTYAKKQIEDDREKELNKSQFLNEIDKASLEEGQGIVDENDTAELVLSEAEPLALKESEKRYLLSLLEKFKLSVTALNNYLDDPKIFLYENLLRIPTAKNEHLILGTIVHKILEIYNRDLKYNRLKKLDTYISLIETLLQKENITLEQKSRISKETKIYLESVLAGYDKKPEEIFDIEYNFGYKNIHLGDIALTGKIDLIESIDSNNQSETKSKRVRIIDYKTGRPKTRNEILGLTKNSDKRLLRQLQFYKLLLSLDKSFNHNPVEFELRFIKPQANGKTRSEIFTADEIDVDEIMEALTSVMKDIRGLKF